MVSHWLFILRSWVTIIVCDAAGDVEATQNTCDDTQIEKVEQDKKAEEIELGDTSVELLRTVLLKWVVIDFFQSK